MTDVLLIFLRALRLLDPRLVRRLSVAALVGVLLAGLDLLGILLLVPFLAYLGPGSAATGFGAGVVERVIGARSQEETAVILAVVATLLFVIRGVGSVALLWVQGGLVVRAQVGLARRILKGFIGAPWIAQQAAGTGALLRTARDSTGSIASIINSGFGAIADLAVALAVFGALLIVNPFLAVGALVYLAAAGFAYLQLLRRPVERRGSQIQAEGVTMNASLIELVGGIRELIIRGSADVYLRRFVDGARRYYTAYRFLTVTSLAMRHLLEILMIGGAALVILVAHLSGSTTVLVSIGVLLAGGLRLVPSLNMLLVNVNNIRAQEWAVATIEADLERFPLRHERRSSDSLRPRGEALTGAFTFDGVTFQYPTRDERAVEDLRFEVRFGETVGVVGGSGAGKSTLVDLLLGFLEPDQGRITVDGVPLRECLDAWRAGIGLVPQEIFIVDDTLAANIAFGEAEEVIDDARMAEAVRLAQLDDVVAELPDGMETLLGERGVMLSGGQRQRVGLARALYRRPRVLILDEATSALDNETERQISDALRSLHGEMTMVVIAHRLSTVRSCDRILFLDEGRIGGIGTFDELCATSAGFARLVELGSLEGTI